MNDTVQPSGAEDPLATLDTTPADSVARAIERARDELLTRSARIEQLEELAARHGLTDAQADELRDLHERERGRRIRAARWSRAAARRDARAEALRRTSTARVNATFDDPVDVA